jgi:hypothetical protein
VLAEQLLADVSTLKPDDESLPSRVAFDQLLLTTHRRAKAGNARRLLAKASHTVRMCFGWALPGMPLQRSPQVVAIPEGNMSNIEHKSKETGKHELSQETNRPEGTVDEDANPPLTDPTKTEVDRNRETVPPQDAASAVPPYEGRT